MNQHLIFDTSIIWIYVFKIRSIRLRSESMYMHSNHLRYIKLLRKLLFTIIRNTEWRIRNREHIRKFDHHRTNCPYNTSTLRTHEPIHELVLSAQCPYYVVNLMPAANDASSATGNRRQAVCLDVIHAADVSSSHHCWKSSPKSSAVLLLGVSFHTKLSDIVFVWFVIVRCASFRWVRCVRNPLGLGSLVDCGRPVPSLTSTGGPSDSPSELSSIESVLAPGAWSRAWKRVTPGCLGPLGLSASVIL